MTPKRAVIARSAATKQSPSVGVPNDRHQAVAAADADRAAVLLARAVLSAAAADRRGDQLCRKRRYDPAVRAAADVRAGRAGKPRDLGQLLHPRAALSARLPEFARPRRAGDIAVPRDRLSDGVRDRARAGGMAAIAAVPGHAAVLDQLSDPRLCLDRVVAAERADQPAAARRRPDRGAVALAVQWLLGRA